MKFIATYFSDLVVPCIREDFPDTIIVNMYVHSHSHNTRIKTNLAVARCQYNVPKHSPLQEGTKLFNALYFFKGTLHLTLQYWFKREFLKGFSFSLEHVCTL